MQRPIPLEPERRRFLLGALASGFGVGSITFAAETAGATTGGPPAIVELWRLVADWGYPVGPKQRVRCRGRACHRHAANKIYPDEASALGGRLHPCCNAQPAPLLIDATTAARLVAARPAGRLELADLRWASTAPIITSLAPTSVPTTAPTTAPTTVPPTMPTTAVAPLPPAGDPSAAAPALLAATGVASVKAATVAALGIAGGALVLRTRPERAPSDDSPDPGPV